jgi:hypothetical protein
MEPDGLQTFIDDVGLVVSSTDDEHEITSVAKRLSDLLAGGYRLPPEVTRPSPVHDVTYPLYAAPGDNWLSGPGSAICDTPAYTLQSDRLI